MKLAIALISILFATQYCASESVTLRYRAYDADGLPQACSSLVLESAGEALIGTYRQGSNELRVAMAFGGSQIRALYSGFGQGRAFTAVFSIADGTVHVRSESRGSEGWKPALRDGDASLYFLLPRLVDLRSGVGSSRFTVFRDDDGRSMGFIFERRGPESIMLDGRSVEAYELRMVPANYLVRIVWPFSYRYYFRTVDLVMLRFEGPDPQARMRRIDLESMVVAR